MNTESLSTKQVTGLSPLEQLRESRARKNADSVSFNFKFIWGLRLMVDLAVVVPTILISFGIIGASDSENNFELTAMSIFFGIEAFFILAFFSRKKWCTKPLNFFSAVSLFNFPVGTYFSIYHFFNFNKIKFNQ